MILTRFVRMQLALFAVAALIGSAVLVVFFLRVPAAAGFGVSTIKAVFPEAARLYERSEVTYRGDPIGMVTDLRLVDGGVEADLRVDDDARIPVGSVAEIHSLSAVGEQYVDIVPSGSAGPYLQPGDSIPVEQTSVPTQIGPVLDQVNGLLATLPRDELGTAIDEAHATFAGLGPDLQRLLDNGRLLLDEADRNVEPTTALLDDLQPVLDTQVATSPEIRALMTDLAAVTDQLRAGDRDIRGLLHDGQPFARQLTGMFQDVAPTLPVLLGNLVSVGDVLLTYNDNLETIAVVYPALTSAVQTVTAPNDAQNSANVDLAVQQNDPPPCITGFVPPEQRRAPSDLSTAPTPNIYCKLPQDASSAVRGARNLPCQEVPGRRAASPAECRGDGPEVLAPDNPPFPPGSPAASLLSPGTPAAGGPVPAVPYDPVTGRGIGLDGQPFVLAGMGSTAPTAEETTWQSLLLTPVGL